MAAKLEEEQRGIVYISDWYTVGLTVQSHHVMKRLRNILRKL